MAKKPRVIGTTIDAIHAAEAQLGRVLPKTFSDWLLANNGLYSLTIFPVYDTRDPRKTWDSIVRCFNNDWQGSIENFSDDDAPPDFSNLLPFSTFGTGDYYCFDYGKIGNSGEPVVVLWSHETGETIEIADSFAMFLTTPDFPR